MQKRKSPYARTLTSPVGDAIAEGAPTESAPQHARPRPGPQNRLEPPEHLSRRQAKKLYRERERAEASRNGGGIGPRILASGRQMLTRNIAKPWQAKKKGK